MTGKKTNTQNLSGEIAQKYYDAFWSMIVQRHQSVENKGFHHGFFEKGITTSREAAQNMNKFITILLGLQENDTKEILDAGCGIGSTSILLAKKYPCSHFYGITISPVEIELAHKNMKKQNLFNVKFILGNFLDMECIDGCFDVAFALESINYSPNKKYFVQEMSRILRPGGKLVVVDWFRTDVPLHSFMQKIYHAWCAGQANISLESHDNFMTYLHEAGFNDVQVRNLYTNIKRSLFYTFLFWFPVFFPMLCRKIIKREKGKSGQEMDYLLASSALDVLIGEGRIAEFLAVTAVKK